LIWNRKQRASELPPKRGKIGAQNAEPEERTALGWATWILNMPERIVLDWKEISRSLRGSTPIIQPLSEQSLAGYTEDGWQR